MKVFFYTLGCKVNQFETAAMCEMFKKDGYEIAESPDDADVCVINSCTVTSSGDKKSVQRLRQAKKRGAVTVLCGCYPQAFPEKAGELFEADIICGNTDRASITGLVRDFLLLQSRIVEINPHTPDEAFESLEAGALPGHTRAFLKVEDGCRRFCSYCIVPYSRGNVRSMPIEEITREANRLSAQGFKEIVLTGINLSCYGQDTGHTIADAVAAASVDGIERLRLGSVEPDILTEQMMLKLSQLPKLCPHFHLALQSGCDRTLAAMRRRYNTRQYLAVAERLRALFPEASFTTDVIVGFPGETDADFSESAEFVSSFGFLKCHIFPYSQRSGTDAAAFPNQLPTAIKDARAKRLAEMCEVSRSSILKSVVGKKVRVIAEAPDDSGRFTGITDEYFPAVIDRSDIKIGDCGIFTATEYNGKDLIVK